MNKCIFLDRDGVINKDYVDYTYTVERFEILDGVIEALNCFKASGYRLVVITNQSGIVKGIYGHDDVKKCHEYFQRECGHLIDAFYYSPWHQNYTNSLSRKPGTLMFERAAAKFDIDMDRSWMIGDRERDLIPARKLGLQTILLEDEVNEGICSYADYVKDNLLDAAKFVLLKDAEIRKEVKV
ncbi:HAD-IIIA family hydrolase [Cytophagaceae bacterium ABcell3]|nr:HAD-IIIA family hydrolase [Cytophagaceae bacterium ABcell3]